MRVSGEAACAGGVMRGLRFGLCGGGFADDACGVFAWRRRRGGVGVAEWREWLCAAGMANWRTDIVMSAMSALASRLAPPVRHIRMMDGCVSFGCAA